MGSRQTTNAFSEQSSSHDMNNLGRVTGNVTSRRTRATIRAPKRIEPKQETYGLPSSSQSQSLIQVDNEGFDTDSSTSTRTRVSRRNKRTQDSVILDDAESSTSAPQIASRPNKRRAIRTEEDINLVSRNEDYPIILLPPPHRSDSPHPTIRRTVESNTIQDSYLQSFNLPTTGDNGGVTLPPISLPLENSTHGRITLPPIRSVLSIGLERSRSPEIEVVDLSSPSYSNNNVTDPYPSNVVDLTISPANSPLTNSPKINNLSPPEIIVIDDDSSEASSAGSPLPSRGLQLKCAICLDRPKDVAATTCGHIFCRECILTALKTLKVCSLCRRPLVKKQIKRLEFKIL